MRAMSAELTQLRTQVPGMTVPAYYKPLTLAQSDKIQRFIQAERAEGDGAKLAITVILCLLDVGGEQIFTMADREWIMSSVPQALLVDIVNEITGGAGDDPIEDAEGN